MARFSQNCPTSFSTFERVGNCFPFSQPDFRNDYINLAKEKKTTIIIVEHVLRFITDISNRIIVLNYGRKIAEGKPGEVMNKREVIEAYLGVSSAIT